jgi:hypothetical protein
VAKAKWQDLEWQEQNGQKLELKKQKFPFISNFKIMN